ncbi:cyclase family protein [Methanofollis fontis]|uniref:Cyclase n=1 Tax=Methanofollis fontis TaxID=2052832 RepID=A0A483CRC5_9EURY|nr:cyclase family protein [Methanofollis fontis]TAJ45663.1 cyclase [Methanofollis fontis]
MYFDVTRELSENILIFPGGDPPPAFTTEDHGAYLLTLLSLSTHTGTHIDAPSHYLKDERTVDRIDPDRLIGPCRVVDLGTVRSIDVADLRGRVEGASRILLKTRFSGEKTFSPDFPHLTPAAAAFLVEAGIVCVGIDSPSIEGFEGDGSVHRSLLDEDIAIIELLDLSAVPEGEYMMTALPLRLKGLDGSPARVILTDRGPHVR